MSRESAVSAIERGDLSELQYVLEESEWDIGSEPLDSKGQTALHIACANGHLDIVKYLVNKKRCSVTVENVYGHTPLMVSFINKQWKMANFLLKIASINELEGTLTGNKKSIVMEVAKGALVASCKNGYFGLVKYLTDYHIVDYKETTQLARRSGNLHIVKYLLTHCQSTMPDDMSEVHIACIQGVAERVKTALDSNGSSLLGTADHFGTTPIHYATLEPNILKMIVQYAGEMLLNIIDSMGNTPLHHSIKYECIESVTILVEAPGCDVNLANLKGETPLIAACKYSNSAIVQLLVMSKRCGLNMCDSERNTALHVVVSIETIGQLENVQCLLQSDRCDPNVINKSGHTPLHIVCHRGNVPLLEALVADKRCDLNIQDGNGDTALHIGVKNVEVVKCLLESGRSRCDIYNEKGLTPFHKAIANGNMASVEVTMKNRVSILQTSNDKFQNPPIHIACIHSRLDILKVLLGCTNCDPNQQNVMGDTALHIVCRMRSDTEVDFLEVLTSTPGINPTLLNLEGNAPIHTACMNSRLESLKVLLSCESCDPNQQNSKGDTALHITCRMRTGNELQFLEVLTSTHGINPTLVNHEGIGPFDVVDSDGNTILHIACAEGNISLVKLLVNNGADVLKLNSHGDAPIHTACELSRLDVLKILLESGHCDPNQQNGSGDVPLHIVCRNCRGSKLPFLKMLLSTPRINPEIVNHEGHTPIEVAGTNYFAIDAIKKFLEHKMSFIQAYLKIFVVGNSGNGKSTLIKAVTTEASQLRKYVPLSTMKYVNPSDVPPHTAGIVPIPFNSKHFGNAVLYDFAGQHEYYSSHAAVMENLILPSPPLFLLLIDISNSKEVIREELVYWWHFINNQSQKAAAPPHVILAGSRKDLVKSRDREELEIMIRHCIKEIPVTFKFVGYFPLDCRKLVSPGLSALLTQLNTTCQSLRGMIDVNLHCHILNALLRAPEFQGLVYCKVVDIMNKIEYDDALLPKAFPQLIPLLASLNDQGHIFLLQNHTDESKSWVILKPDILLTEVNGSVFAPEYFKEHCEFAMSTGVVPLSKLKQRFTEYNHKVIVKYLTHLEFCFRIKDQHTLDMITNDQMHKSIVREEYYFFPSLVHVENPTDVCQPHQSIGYECGWLYKCSKEIEQLTTRFLHVLILRLAFACASPDDPKETESVVLLRSCSVWKHGIAWWTNDGIEVIVEVGLQCHWVAVMLRCPDAKKVECAELRSKVISTVLKTKKKFCPTITLREYLIAPSSLKYPFKGRELTLYSMREVARATIEGKMCVKDTRGENSITIPQLLPFEPYHNMGDLIWKFFSGDTSVAVTPEELIGLAEKCHDKLAELNTAFKPDISSFQEECMKADCIEVERCVALFYILQRRGRFKTWRDFQQEFSRFSICKQSLLEHTQKDKDRTLGDDTDSEISITSDSVIVSQDVPLESSSAIDDTQKDLISDRYVDLQLSQTLSDERVQEIIVKAQELDTLTVRKVVSTLTGFSGSGKTWLLNYLFHKLPPDLYTSTGIAEQSYQGLLLPIDNVSVDPWTLPSHTNIFECLDPFFPESMTEANATLSTSLVSPSLPSPVHSKLQPTSKGTMSGSRKEILLELVHMIDAGGQPEIMEIMPSVVHNTNLAVLVLNLMYSLDEHPPIYFHVEGMAYKRNMPSQYTARQIIKKLVATLQAKRSSHKKGNLFQILMVATHQDCVKGDLEARVKTLNRELRTLLLPSCNDQLIYYSPGQIAFVIKLKNPDSHDQETLQLIRSKISTRKVIEMPSSFLMYKKDLLKYATKEKRSILSLDECVRVGNKLKMNNELVIAALVFFHRNNTFLYHRKVLPNLIFVEPQVPLVFINAVIQCSYKISSGSSDTKFSSYLAKGIITEEMLRQEFHTSFVPGFYEPHHAIKLLCHIFTLAPLSHEQKLKTSKNSPEPIARMSHVEEKEYLMMCLLTAIPDQKLDQYIPSSSEMMPLVVRFTGDCVPLGCFSSTISCLLSRYEWTVSRNEDNSPECLAHNIVSLFCSPHLLKVVLVDSSDHIDVYVKDLPESFLEVRQEIFGAIRKVLDIMHLTEIKIFPAVLCPCQKISQSHPASLIEVKSEMLLYCPKTKSTQGTADEKHVKHWFGDNPLENTSPEYILQAALQDGSIPHRDDKFLIHGPGGVGKSSLVAMFLKKKRDFTRKSTPLATKPLHLTPIRDVSTSRFNSNWEEVDYERLSHMIAHACYKRYLLKGRVEKESGGNAGECMEEEIEEGMAKDEVESIVKLTDEDSPSLTSPAVELVQESGRLTQQQELHKPKQNEPELSLDDELKDELEDEDEGLPHLTTTLEDDEIQRVIENYLQGLRDKIRDTKEGNEDILSHSIRILDSGGQPQFHELIAIFLSYISGLVSVFKLNEDLSENGEVVFYDDGEPISNPYKSYYSHEQVIRHDLQALQAEAVQRRMQAEAVQRRMQAEAMQCEMPNIAFVGTFLDKAYECKETPAMKDKRLYRIITEILPEEMQKCVITCGNSLDQSAFKINARTPQKKDFDQVEELKGALLKHSKVQPRDLPLKWHGLEIAFHVLMEKLDRQALRRDECEVIAYNLSFDLNSLNEALDYLHKLNIIAYYRDVLPNVIFGSSQVVLNMITALVCHSLVLNGKSGLSGEERNFIHRGIVSLQFLRSSAFEKNYIIDLFQPEDLLEVLKSQLVISPVGETEFIMPCVLEVKNIDSIPKDSRNSSFILNFSKKSPMFGVYCCTVSSLISNAGWELLRMGGKVVQVARNSFTFEVPGKSPGKLIFCDPLSSYFEVILELPAIAAAKHCVKVYHEIRDEFLKAITKAMETLHYDVVLPEVSFLCPEQSIKCSVEPHPAIIDYSQTYLTCSLNHSVCFCLTNKQKMWLQKAAGTKQYSKESESTANISNPDVVPTPRDDIRDQKIAENAGLKPSMKDLANQVIPTVCPIWRDIGLQLNLDISIFNEIRANCQGDVRECCTVMFDKWLKQDAEASWCRVLDACRTVKDNLSSCPDEPLTKDHIKALTRLLISTLPDFLANL